LPSAWEKCYTEMRSRFSFEALDRRPLWRRCVTAMHRHLQHEPYHSVVPDRFTAVRDSESMMKNTHCF
jgi:hypothetical protein